MPTTLPTPLSDTCRLADVLAEWREGHRLPVAEAARRAGVQTRTWLSWESGTEPQLSVLPGLAVTLGVECTDLLELLPARLEQQTAACNEVATAIRAWRRREAMSLARAGRRLGVSPSTVLDWESGRRPRTTQLTKLIAAGVVAR